MEPQNIIQKKIFSPLYMEASSSLISVTEGMVSVG